MGLVLSLLTALPLAGQDRSTPHAEARAHAVAGRTDRALSMFDSLRAVAPLDREAALGAATALAWGKRYADAELRYRDILARWPDDLEAAQGMARLTAWRGDLEASERQWRALIALAPQVPDHWLGLAQALRWQDRGSEAIAVLDEALRLDPTHAEVRAERRRLYAAFANSIEPSIRQHTDSEGNATWSITLATAVPLSRGHVARVVAVERAAGLGLRAGRSRGVDASAELVFADRAALLLEGGVLQLADAEQSARLLPSARVRGRWTPNGRLRLDGSLGRTVLDETAPLIANAIVMDGGLLAAQLRLGPIWSLGASGSVASLSGGAERNQRAEWVASLVAGPSPALELGARVRQVRHSRLATDGYFSPRQHDIAEATVRWEPGRSVGWGGRLEGALGVQRVALNGPAQQGPAQRVYAGLARRWELGGQVQLGYEYTSVAGVAPPGAANAAAYWRRGVVASGRLPLLR
jgi:tetratricopeptide (TPR) repeat protein